MEKKNNSFKEIWSKMIECKSVVMSLHPSPDGDSFGSCTALKYVLEREGINVRLISPSELPKNLEKLKIASEVEVGTDISDVINEDYDAFIFLDYASYKSFSVKKMGSFVVPEKVFSINIDHHKTNEYQGSMNYVDYTQPALCSVLVDFFREVNVEFDAELSTRLLIGVCTDSGFFTYDSNPNKALDDAYFLIQNGADYLNGILRPILYSQPFSIKKYFGYLLNNVKFNEEFKCGYVSIPYGDVKIFGLNGADLRLGINELQFIDEFQFVFTLIEMEDHIKGSFRSKKSVDVSKFAEELGGGGHKSAASFSFMKISLNEAEKKVFEAIRKVKNI